MWVKCHTQRTFTLLSMPMVNHHIQSNDSSVISRNGRAASRHVPAQGYDALSKAAMDMLREAGVDRALSADGLPSPSFPGTYFHPPGHIWDWDKHELVTNPGEAEASEPAGKHSTSSALLTFSVSVQSSLHCMEQSLLKSKPPS